MLGQPNVSRLEDSMRRHERQSLSFDVVSAAAVHTCAVRPEPAALKDNVPRPASAKAQALGDHPGLIVALEVRVIPQDLLKADNVGVQTGYRGDRA
jgi:hypothetical protein